MDIPAIDQAFWKGRRVFLTGHTGFKGAWLSSWLLHLGADVTGFALDPAQKPNLFDLEGLAGKLRDIRGDIRDLGALQRAVRDAKPEIVLHLAAQALVKAGYDDPLTTYSTNVMGTANLLQVLRGQDSVRAVVVVTSDKVYEDHAQADGYREGDVLGGFDPYSNSKCCTEHVAATFRNSYFPVKDHDRHGVAVATARAGNVIGGGDWSDNRLIPDIVRAFDAEEELVIRSPKAVRPWQHVLEPLAGYLMLARALTETGPAFAEAWNFGPHIGNAQPVDHIVNYVTRLWPGKTVWRVEPSGMHETHYLHVDSTKARERLGWRPQLDFHATLDMTMAWYAADAKGSAAGLVDQHIKTFMALQPQRMPAHA